MAGPKGTHVLSKSFDGVFGGGVSIYGVGVFVGDVNVIASDQSNAQHNLGHDWHPRRLIVAIGPRGRFSYVDAHLQSGRGRAVYADVMAPCSTPLRARVSTPADIDEIVATMTTAFFDDPMWGPAFPDVEHRTAQASALWRLLVASAQRYPWTLVTENAESAALWIPPGGTELTNAEQSGLEQFLIDITSPAVAEGILAIFDQFEAARPSEPHFYLSLLATHSNHRGAGLGMGLLKENLARIDALGGWAYLESCNPVNNERYRSVGFTARAEITIASGHRVTTMWRSAR